MTRFTNFIAASATAIAAFGAALPALAGGHGMKNIVEIAAGDERFSTLVAAVTAADLGETLSGEGPFTVFAPVDDAFAALPEGTLEGLLEPGMKDDLTNVLMYHVVSGAVMSGDIPMGTMASGTALDGANLCVTRGEGVMLDDGSGMMANVIVADIEASNGVIHVVDKVLLPGNDPDC
ncbi:fasciclin domain-containing protein [Aquicoccus porphyridii]|uniref:Fasciclin domain-containing protein n=1 Tax=Aquicoccus porphyridii TaxID=1852029 RepID=A0A5A9YXV0_9RHOB|nr:fasciclin domain-containing protein [Aquicoccus porphyridii]KAA0909843.1 fasciclin domain-containing protein [Aquicoccus porphyridii]RAI53244.1 fasciclin domain-containing protein [Rhodobacteraceae bacterium AsT-22]